MVWVIALYEKIPHTNQHTDSVFPCCRSIHSSCSNDDYEHLRTAASVINRKLQRPASLSAFEKENISKEDALNILKQMNSEFDSRIRILDENGFLLADSSTLETDATQIKPQQSRSSKSENQKEASETFVYKLFSIPIRIIRKFRPPVASYDSADFYSDAQIFDGPEIKQALNGEYGSATYLPVDSAPLPFILRFLFSCKAKSKALSLSHAQHTRFFRTCMSCVWTWAVYFSGPCLWSQSLQLSLFSG